MSVNLIHSQDFPEKNTEPPVIHIDSKIVIEYLDEPFLSEYLTLRKEYPNNLVLAQDVQADTWGKIERIKELESLALKKFSEAVTWMQDRTRKRVNAVIAA